MLRYSELLYSSLCRTRIEVKMQQNILYGTHIRDIEVREFIKASLSPSNLHHPWSKISGTWIEDIKLCYLFDKQLLEIGYHGEKGKEKEEGREMREGIQSIVSCFVNNIP